MAYATVSVSAVAPSPDRPSEGTITVNTIASTVLKDNIDAKVLQKENARIASILEQTIRETRAIDMESLCIVAGKKVWSLQCDIVVLNDAGNSIDCGCIAAFGALTNFRRPDVSVVGETITIHHIHDRDPIPLSIHHVPLCTTFALYLDEESGVSEQESPFFSFLDPSDREELAQDGSITIVSNAHKEICGIHKFGWPPLSHDKFAELVLIATERSSLLEKKIVQNL